MGLLRVSLDVLPSMTSLICSLQKLPKANKACICITLLTRIRSVLLEEVSQSSSLGKPFFHIGLHYSSG